MSGTFVHILKTDGPLGLYSGISASLLRQLTYSTVRFGVYEELKTRAIRNAGGRDPSFAALTAMSMSSGFLGGIAGNFADVLNVRMQHDAALPPAERIAANNGAEHGLAERRCVPRRPPLGLRSAARTLLYSQRPSCRGCKSSAQRAHTSLQRARLRTADGAVTQGCWQRPAPRQPARSECLAQLPSTGFARSRPERRSLLLPS